MLPQDLIAAGFRRSTESNRTKSPHAVALYQKRIYTPDGQDTLYFVDVWEWNTGHMKGANSAAVERYKFSIEGTLYRDPLTMKVSLYYEPTMTPADIEAFYADTHTRLGCGLDPHN